jgi:UDP-N-acetylglucosamine 2-epimerase (non-hydrolysing)
VKIIHIVGARPNFMKIAPVVREMRRRGGFEQCLVHTGQHYDANMSDAFFRDLELPDPYVHLGVGAGSHAEQTARVMTALEPVLVNERPDWVVVVGDVNSTLAAAVVCAKLPVKVAHVEAGLRSFDRTMPEEINRILTDQVADLLFTTEESANRNLANEGVSADKIHFVGNVMIDSLVTALAASQRSAILEQLRIEPRHFVLVTMHRPSNVDDPQVLAEVLHGLTRIADDRVVIFPVHPRTRARIEVAGARARGIRLLDPLGYLDFLRLSATAALVLTDSGGVQEETTFLGVPCLTMRATTERPVTVECGTNRLIPSTSEAIVAALDQCLSSARGVVQRPPLWDGKAAERIVDVFCALAFA